MKDANTKEQKFISKLTEIVLSQLSNKDFGVNELVREAGISRNGLNRRLRKILNKSINQFIREVRLQKALEMLRNESLTAAEVAFKVGFSSPTYFNTCFQKYFGYSPGKAKEENFGISEGNVGTQLIPEYDQRKPDSQSRIYPRTKIFVISILIIISSVLAYQKIFRQQTLDDLRSDDGRISLAVFPFNNMTNARIWDEIQNSIISYLSNFEEFEVRQKEAVNSLPESKGIADYASISPSIARSISRKLDVNIFICGDISQAGSLVRVNANLVNPKSKEVLRSFQIKGKAEGEEIFKIMDSISVSVSDFLLKSKMEKEVSFDLKPYRTTNSPEAFQFLVEADEALRRYDTRTALSLYSKAVAIDSNYVPAIIFLSMRYKEMGNYKEAKKWCDKAYAKRDRMNKNERIMADWYHATLFGNPFDEIKFLKQYQEADDQVPISYFIVGDAYLRLFQYDKAIPEFLNALEIYKKWKVKPMMSQFYAILGYAYNKTGQYKKEKRLYRKAMIDFPGDHYIISRCAILALTEGDTVNANRYIRQYRSVLKDLSYSETSILSEMASVYTEANFPDEAIECYREALLLDPDNIRLINDLAYLLIDRNMDINNGLNLIESALKSEPDNYFLLHTKGWALYKLGESLNALEILKKSWELKPVYDRLLFLHLEEVQSSVSDQKKVGLAQI